MFQEHEVINNPFINHEDLIELEPSHDEQAGQQAEMIEAVSGGMNMAQEADEIVEGVNDNMPQEPAVERVGRVPIGMPLESALQQLAHVADVVSIREQMLNSLGEISVNHFLTTGEKPTIIVWFE